MPRVLALADTQIGVSTVDLADQAQVLDRIADVALEREVDLVIHGGDVFEGATVTPEQLRVFLDFNNRLRAEGLVMICIRGNGRHDLATRSVHALDVLNEIENIEVHDRPGITAHADVGVVTLPWVSPGNLIAQWGRDVDHDRVNDYAGKLLVQIAAEQLERLHESRFVHESQILVAHWAISGSTLPTGLPADQMREPILSWADLDAIGFDCVIGAHVHQGQQISRSEIDSTLGIVVGSPQPLNHGEAGYEHGCWIVDIERGESGNAVSTEFVPIPSKRFLTIDADVETLIDLVTSPSSREWVNAEDTIIRVRFSATEDEARRVDHDMLRRELVAAGASRVSIEPQIIRESRARAESVSEEINATEALRAWCRAESIADDLRERLLDTLREWSAA